MSIPEATPDASHLLPAVRGSQHFRGTQARRGLLSAWPGPGPEKPASPRFPRGVPRSSPARTPPLIPRDARCAAPRHTGPDPRRATVNTGGGDTLRPAHPGHAPSLSAPGRPARSLGFRLSCRCFVPDEYSRPAEQVVLGPALEVSPVSQFPASATLAPRPGRGQSFRRRAQAARVGGCSWPYAFG